MGLSFIYLSIQTRVVAPRETHDLVEYRFREFNEQLLLRGRHDGFGFGHFQLLF